MDEGRRISFCVSSNEVSTNVNSDVIWPNCGQTHACTCMPKPGLRLNLTGTNQRGRLSKLAPKIRRWLIELSQKRIKEADRMVQDVSPDGSVIEGLEGERPEYPRTEWDGVIWRKSRSNHSNIREQT